MSGEEEENLFAGIVEEEEEENLFAAAAPPTPPQEDEPILEEMYEDIKPVADVVVGFGEGTAVGTSKMFGDLYEAGKLPLKAAGEIADRTFDPRTPGATLSQRAMYATGGLTADTARFLNQHPAEVIDAAGMMASTALGGMLGTAAAPGLGTGIGMVAGGGAWNAFANFIGLNGEEDIRKSAREVARETGEEIGPDVIFGSLGQLMSAKRAKNNPGVTLDDELVEVERITNRAQRAARRARDRSAYNRSRMKQMKKLFGEKAEAKQMDALDFSAEQIGERVLKGTIQLNGGKIPPEDQVITKMMDWLVGPRNPKKLRGGRKTGFVQQSGKAVDNAIKTSSATFNSSRIKKMINTTLGKLNGTPGDIDDMREVMMRPFLDAIAEKGDIKQFTSDVTFPGARPDSRIDLGGDAVSDYLRDISELKRQQNKARLLAGSSKDGALEEMQNLQREIKDTQGRIDFFNRQADAVELEALDFYKAVRKVGNNTTFPEGLKDFDAFILGDFTDASQTLIKKGMTSPELRRAYEVANADYTAARTLAEWLDPARVSEIDAYNTENLLALEFVRFGRDIRFGNTPAKPLKWETFIRAIEAPEGVSVWRQMIDDTMNSTIAGDALEEVFTPQRLNKITEVADKIESTGDPDTVTLVETLRETAQVIYDGIGQSPEVAKGLMKKLWQNRAIRSYLPSPTSAHAQELPFYGDTPLDRQAAEQYKRKVRNDESLTSIERSKLIKHLNANGEITNIEPRMRQDTPLSNNVSDRAAEFEKMRTGKQVVQKNRLDHLSTPKKKDSNLRLVSAQQLEGMGATDFIKEHEGFRLKAYQDSGGVWTVGYGSIRGLDGKPIKKGQEITAEEAQELLDRDADSAVRAVERHVKVPLTDEQRAALVSFAYNVGNEALRTSTLLKKLNSGDYEGAAREFPRWNKVKKKVIPGLTNRRRAEAALFRKGIKKVGKLA